MICPRCGKENKNDFKYCSYCGEELKSSSEIDNLEDVVAGTKVNGTCPNCGQSINPYDESCKFCGEYLKGNKPSSYMICANCGKYNAIENEYCSNCGMSFAKKQEAKEPEHVNHIKELILGSVSASLALVGFTVAFFGQIAAIVVGIIAVVKSSKALKTHDKKATIGLILGIVGIVLGVVGFILWIVITLNVEPKVPPILEPYFDDESSNLIVLFKNKIEH